MNNFLTRFLILFFLITSLIFASQKETDNIAQMSALSLSNFNKVSLQTTVKTYMKNNPNIKALKIVESLNKDAYISIYKENNKIILDKTLPKNINQYDFFKAESIHKGKPVGKVFAYFQKKIGINRLITLSNKEQKWLDTTPIVKLAVMNYWDTDDSGNNIHIDLITLLNKYSSFPIVPIKFDQWKQGFSAASKGEIIHGIMNLSWSQEREKKNFYYTRAYHFIPSQLIVKKENTSIKTLKDLKNKTIYLREKSVTHNSIEDQTPTTKVIDLTSDSNIYKTLHESKEAVALLDYDYDKEKLKKYELKIVQDVYDKYSEVSVGVSKKHPELASIIDKIYKVIPKDKLLKLRNNGYEKEKIPTLSLTPQEDEWVKLNQKVNIIKFFEEPPFTLNTNPKSGYLYELIEYLVTSAGLKINYIEGLSSYAAMLESLEKGQSDILTAFPTSLELEKNSNIIKSKSVLKTPFVIVGKSNENKVETIEDLFGKKIAVVKGYLQDKYLSKFPKIQKVYVNNNIEGFESIRSGNAQYYINNRANTEYILHKSFSTDLRIIFELSYEQFPPLSLSFAMNGQKKMLVSILQKALDQISYKKVKSIRDKWIVNSSIKMIQNINLTSIEKKWIKENKIKVGVEQWVPVIFSNTGKDIDGITGDILKIIIEKTGLKIEIINDLWDPLLMGLKNKTIDLLPATYYTDERATYGVYSSGYYKMLDYIYVKEDNLNIQSMSDLNGKTLAIQKGYGTIPKIQKKFPKIVIVETVDLTDSINRVLDGKVDALYDGQIAVEYKLQDDLITGLKGIAQKDFESANLYLFSRSDKPILHSILNKALKSIPKYEINKIKSKWLLEKRKENQIKKLNQEVNGLKSHKNSDETWWILIGSTVVFLFIFLLILILTRFISDDFVAKNFGTLKFRIITLVGISILIMVVSVLVYFTLERNKESITQISKDELKYVLSNTKSRLDSWIEDKQKTLTLVGRDAKLVELTKALIKLGKNDEILKHSKELGDVRDYFKKRKREFGDLGFFIIDKDSISIASKIDTNIGTKNLIAKYKPELLKKVFQGEAVFIPPIPSDVKIKLNQRKHLTMFFAIPIQDKEGNVIAVLTQRLDVEGKLSEITQTGHIGKSGESYLFDKDGFMLSKSRFNDLHTAGLLKKDDNEYHEIILRDPGGNLLNGFKPEISFKDMPLTQMAQHAISLNKKSYSRYSKTYSNFKGYRDYRGVNVFGVWIWNNEFGIGLTTEMDEEEALSGYVILRQNLLIVTTLTMLLSIMSTVMLIILGEKATRSIHKVNDELNISLSSFDENVIASKTDLQGVITYASKALCKINGYTKEELIGSPQNIIRHPDMPKALFQDFWQTLKSGNTWRGEIKNRKKNGGFYWVDVVAEPIFDLSGKAIGYSAIRQDITSKKEVEEKTKILNNQKNELVTMLKIFDKNINSSKSDLEGIITYASKAFSRTIGYKIKELIGKPHSMLRHPDMPKEAFKDMWETIQSGKTWRGEVKSLRKDGGFIWCDTVIEPEFNDKGEIIRYSALRQDITAKKEVEELSSSLEQKVINRTSQLQKSQEEISQNKLFLDALLDSQEQIVITTDGKKLRSVNQTFLDFFSLENMEEFTKNYDSICDKFEFDDTNTYLQKEMGEFMWIDYVIEHDEISHKTIILKDGVERTFSVTAAVMPIEDGTIKSAVFTDITELEMQKKQTDSILSSVLLPMLITSKKTRKIVYANSYAENQYETTLDEILGSEIDVFYTKVEQERILKEMNKKGKVQNFETRLKTFKGNEFDALLSLVAITYGGEECLLGVTSDITEQKDREFIMKKLHKNVTDSIEYASLIQHSLIPDNEEISKYFEDFFTIWHPKDIVGGDIYLFEELRSKNECLMLVIDCTGHGVPGAFVTMLVKAIERQVIANILNSQDEVSPAFILEFFNKTMKKLLKQEDDESISNAGFDGGILYYNRNTNIVRYAGAETPLIYVKNNELTMIKGDRHSIGYKKSDPNFKFTDYEISIDVPTKLYITTDGYFDQNGGKNAFPFGKKRFKKFIEEIHPEKLADQKELLLYEMQGYQGDEERNDDITLVGLSINPINNKDRRTEDRRS